MKVIHLKKGWKDEDFQDAVQQVMDEHEKLGFTYYDIKISSKDPDCLVIFKQDNTTMMENRG